MTASLNGLHGCTRSSTLYRPYQGTSFCVPEFLFVSSEFLGFERLDRCFVDQAFAILRQEASLHH